MNRANYDPAAKLHGELEALVVREPITTGGFTIIPIVSAYFGLGTGGGEGTE